MWDSSLLFLFGEDSRGLREKNGSSRIERSIREFLGLRRGP